MFEKSTAKLAHSIFVFNCCFGSIFRNRYLCLSAIGNACLLDRQRLLAAGILSFFISAGNPQCHRGSDLLYTEWDSRGPTAAILSTFLAHHVKRAAKYPIVYQDREAYYLAEEAGKPTLRLEKPECLELTTTFDGAKVFLGERQEFWGFSVIQLFVLNEEPPRLPVHFPKTQGMNRKGSFLLISVLFLREQECLLTME